MRDKIKACATGGRSMNDIIVDALEQYFLRQEEKKAGWRWVEPKHQIDTGLLGELEAIAHAEEGNVPVAVSINSAISRYVAEYFGDSKSDDWQDAEIATGSLATKEELGALREEMSKRMGRIEQLLIEITGKAS